MTNQYRDYLKNLILFHTGKPATELQIDTSPAWANSESVPEKLNERLSQFGWFVPADQWGNLTRLQRFALIKLCREGHENKNLPRAMKEFNLAGQLRIISS